jgi:hypothetical protein
VKVSRARYHAVPGQVQNCTWLELILFSAGNQGDFFMKKILIGIILILAVFFTLGLVTKRNVSVNVQTTSPISEVISYKGESGKDALTLLKEKFSVSQDNSGMVSSIVGRKTDSSKHEYWAFYVNGKTANVGPADYKTKNTDLIEWKIEKY